MTGQRSRGAAIAALAAGLLGLAPLLAITAAEPAAPVRIGLVRTLLRDVPEPMLQLLMQPFKTLMKAQTGLEGELIPCNDSLALGQLLQEKKMELGVFNGFEFAWARQKYPELRPLCIAINRHRHLTANLVVRDDCAAVKVTDLKGKVLALPRFTREQCRLFLDRLCRENHVEPRTLFARIIAPNVEDALDDVVRGKLDAALVDGVALECYQQVKSACHARLKVFKQSENFPAAVVAYRHDALDDSTLQRFRQGMIGASQNERGRDLMTMWKLTAFEDVPADYAQNLASILRAYPYLAPVAATTEVKTDVSH